MTTNRQGHLNDLAITYLLERAVTEKYADGAGLKYVDGSTAYKMGSPNKKAEAILIPLFHPFTKEEHDDLRRFKYLSKPYPKDRHGKPMKFGQPADSGQEAYFDPHRDWSELKGTVYLVEGEIKALAMNAIGLPTIALLGVDMHGGEDDFTPWMKLVLTKVNKLVIVFDNDEREKKGVRAAKQKIAAKARAHGIEPWTVNIPFNGAKLGADDYIAKYGKAAFLKLVENAKQMHVGGGKATVKSIDTVVAKNISWLIPGLVPLSMLTALAGDMSQGKSTIIIDWAAQLSRKGKGIKTIYITNENVAAVATRPKWEVAGGKNGCLLLFDGVETDDGGKRRVTFDDVEIIRTLVRDTGAKLVVFDPIQSFIGAKVDTHKANQTRDKLDPLGLMANEEEIAMIFVSHAAKSGANRAVNVMLGSVDIGATMRSIMVVGSAPEDPDQHALILAKPAAEPQPAQAYAMEKVNDGGKGMRVRIKWGGETSLTYADLKAPEERAKGRVTEDAREKVMDALTDEFKAVADLSLDLGYSERTVRRAMEGSDAIERQRIDKREAWRKKPKNVGLSKKYARQDSSTAPLGGSVEAAAENSPAPSGPEKVNAAAAAKRSSSTRRPLKHKKKERKSS